MNNECSNKWEHELWMIKHEIIIKIKNEYEIWVSVILVHEVNMDYTILMID